MFENVRSSFVAQAGPASPKFLPQACEYGQARGRVLLFPIGNSVANIGGNIVADARGADSVLTGVYAGTTQ